jgi:prepilin peptidase CpaA
MAAGVLSATVIDLRTRRIPNELTAAMTGIGIAMAATGVSGISVAGSFLGFALGLALMLPGFGLGATGAGDVKLMGAIGAIVGPGMVVSAFLFTAIAGGVLAVAVAMQRQRLGATLAGTGRLIAAPADVRGEIRQAAPSSRFAYGPAIAVGSVLAALIG